jgi:hypothetical protein
MHILQSRVQAEHTRICDKLAILNPEPLLMDTCIDLKDVFPTINLLRQILVFDFDPQTGHYQSHFITHTWPEWQSIQHIRSGSAFMSHANQYAAKIHWILATDTPHIDAYHFPGLHLQMTAHSTTLWLYNRGIINHLTIDPYVTGNLKQLLGFYTHTFSRHIRLP